MSIKYKTVPFVVPAGGSITGTLLSTTSNKKITLLGAAMNGSPGYMMSIGTNDNYTVQVPGELNTGYGNFITLNTQLTEATLLQGKLDDIGGGAATINITIMYEE